MNNCDDQCPNTASLATVDSQGCLTDDDGDDEDNGDGGDHGGDDEQTGQDQPVSGLCPTAATLLLTLTFAGLIRSYRERNRRLDEQE